MITNFAEYNQIEQDYLKNKQYIINMLTDFFLINIEKIKNNHPGINNALSLFKSVNNIRNINNKNILIEFKYKVSRTGSLTLTDEEQKLFEEFLKNPDFYKNQVRYNL